MSISVPRDQCRLVNLPIALFSYEKPISTIDDFLESGLNWAADDYAWAKYLEPDETVSIPRSIRPSSIVFHWKFQNFQPRFKSLLSKFKLLSAEEIRKQMISQDICIAFEKLESDAYGPSIPIVEDDLDYYQILDETFYWSYTALWSQKDWPLMPLVSQFIGELSAFGIHEYYDRIVNF